MKQAEMIANLSANCGITKAVAKHILDAIGEMLTDELVQTGRTNLFTLGALTVVEKAARTGRNPQNGEPIQVPAKRAVKYKASSTLKATLNG